MEEFDFDGYGVGDGNPFAEATERPCGFEVGAEAAVDDEEADLGDGDDRERFEVHADAAVGGIGAGGDEIGDADAEEDPEEGALPEGVGAIGEGSFAESGGHAPGGDRGGVLVVAQSGLLVCAHPHILAQIESSWRRSFRRMGR